MYVYKIATAAMLFCHYVHSCTPAKKNCNWSTSMGILCTAHGRAEKPVFWHSLMGNSTFLHSSRCTQNCIYNIQNLLWRRIPRSKQINFQVCMKYLVYMRRGWRGFTHRTTTTTTVRQNESNARESNTKKWWRSIIFSYFVIIKFELTF